MGVTVIQSGRFGGAVDPGLALLQSATLWLDASNPGSDAQVAANRGTGGTALDARYGSTTGVDTNDPLLLPHSGTNYLYLPGLTGNGGTTPDAAVLRVVGDIDLRVHVALDDWTPSATQVLIAKRDDDATNFGYALGVKASGVLTFDFGNTSTTILSADSSAATGHTDGTAYWVRATRASATGTVTFYTSPDGTSPSWTQLGTTVATTAGAIFAATTQLYVGGFSGSGVQTSSIPTGKVFRAMVLDGIAGTTVFDANFTTNTNQSTFTESSSNAATVTINRATSGRKAVMVVRPTLLFGTDDYLEVADNDLLDFGAAESFTVVACVRRWATPRYYGTLVGKGPGGTSAGWLILNNDTLLFSYTSIADGSVQVNGSSIAYTAGTLGLTSAIRNVSLDTVRTWQGTTESGAVTDTTTGSLANANPLRVGNDSSGSYPSDMEVVHVAVFRSVLTSTELGQIATYLGV